MKSYDEMKQEIAHYNKWVSDAINTLMGISGELSAYERKFDGQREILARIGMAKRVLNAASGQLTVLRPKISMIREGDNE